MTTAIHRHHSENQSLQLSSFQLLMQIIPNLESLESQITLRADLDTLDEWDGHLHSEEYMFLSADILAARGPKRLVQLREDYQNPGEDEVWYGSATVIVDFAKKTVTAQAFSDECSLSRLDLVRDIAQSVNDMLADATTLHFS